MLKRIFCIAVSLLLIGNLILFSFAEEKDVTLLHNCDSSFGSFRLDKDSERGSCIAHTFSAGTDSFANQTQFKPIDASEGDTLAIEVYLSDPAMLANIRELYVEITSSGTCDKQENAWPLHSVLKSGKVKAGWNTIYLYLNESYETEGACDLSAINYIRIFGFFDGKAISGETIKFDYIRMIYTGGYDYADLSMTFYRGDNTNVDIYIDGQNDPDLENRHSNITMTVGGKVQ